jgi:endonuclease/exonuclease/phosphatase family metal-dependent hydrolase
MSSEIPEDLTSLAEVPASEPYSSLRDSMASFLHRAARAQAHLFWWYTEKLFSHLFFTKKECCSLIEKVVCWGKRCCLIALSIPLLSWTFLLAETELLTRISAQIVAQKSFTYLQGSFKEKILEKGKPLTVFSLNTCFVAGGFSLFYGGVAPWPERVDQLIEKIQEKNPDLLCLQEVNDIEAAYRLYDALKDQYAHFYFNIGPKVLSQNSGLFVASKLAIQDPSFKTFDEVPGTQKLVNKGFFDCQILSDAKVVAHLFLTHLSPSSDDGLPTSEEKEIRKKELEMIFAKMKSFTKEAPIIFAGDFNITREDDEASILKEEFQDLFPKGEKSNATNLLKQACFAHSDKEIEEAKLTNPEFSIDYILFKPGKSKCKGKVSLVKSYNVKDANPTQKALSDHHALFAEFFLRV